MNMCECGCGQLVKNKRARGHRGQDKRTLNKTAEERFLENVEKTETCWLWRPAKNPNHYGQFYTGNKVQGKWESILSHIWAYKKYVGPIPEGYELDHLCRVRKCCNPAHLEPVTQRVNILRGENITAQNARKTHCLAGHLLSEENIYIHPKTGSRLCRECRKFNQRKHYQKHPKIKPLFCPQNHLYEGENLYISPRGTWACRICIKAYREKYCKNKKRANV